MERQSILEMLSGLESKEVLWWREVDFHLDVLCKMGSQPGFPFETDLVLSYGLGREKQGFTAVYLVVVKWLGLSSQGLDLTEVALLLSSFSLCLISSQK